MKFLAPIAISIILLLSCKTDTDTNKDEQLPYSINTNDPYIVNTQNLLQGRWINLDQKGVSIVFENNTRVENIKGKPEGKPRYFEISDGCQIDIPGSRVLAKSKAKYITLQEVNLCYYIIKLDKSHLDLKVVGRGNIIRYRKEGTAVHSPNDGNSLKLKSKN